MPLWRSIIQFLILFLAIAFLADYGSRLLQGDLSPVVIAYTFGSLWVAIWLFRLRRHELMEIQPSRPMSAKPEEPKPHWFNKKIEEKKRVLVDIEEQFRAGQLDENTYRRQKTILEKELGELTRLEAAVFDGKQAILRELGRRRKIKRAGLETIVGNREILDEAIAELLEEELLQRAGPDEYKFNYGKLFSNLYEKKSLT